MAQVIKAKRGSRAPTHPGALLRDTVLPALGLPVTTIARHLRITRQQLHRVLSTQSGVSPEMAYRLGKLCGNGPVFWIRMQEAYDLWQAGQRVTADLEHIPTLQAAPREFETA